ncbi:MAG: thymidylate synthase [Clostridiales bacterium]|nr:thymidylate synthase [Clostridiales bacterium]
MNKVDKMYIDNIKEIMEEGSDDFDGNVRPVYKDGTPSHTKFITQNFEKYDLSKGEYPITALRRIRWKAGIKEIFWIYQDQTNELEVLKDKYNIHWWDEWAVGDGKTIGMRYGGTVRKYDLMNGLLKGIIEQPYGRRHVMSLWQETDFKETEGLNPCAFMSMWSVRKDKSGKRFLDMTLIQRSNDYLVAGHINKIQYVALQMMVARHCELEPGIFAHYTHNLHIYDRHFDQANELIKRYEEHGDMPQPKLVLKTDKTNFFEFTLDDFIMENYDPIKPQLKFDLGI